MHCGVKDKIRRLTNIAASVAMQCLRERQTNNGSSLSNDIKSVPCHIKAKFKRRRVDLKRNVTQAYLFDIMCAANAFRFAGNTLRKKFNVQKKNSVFSLRLVEATAMFGRQVSLAACHYTGTHPKTWQRTSMTASCCVLCACFVRLGVSKLSFFEVLS